jgi:hypothetical protein
LSHCNTINLGFSFRVETNVEAVAVDSGATSAAAVAAEEEEAATTMVSTLGRDRPEREDTAATTIPAAAETSTGGEIKKEKPVPRKPHYDQRFAQFMRSVWRSPTKAKGLQSFVQPMF